MTNPEVLKQILRSAKEEIEKWPEWMKNQEPMLRERPAKDAPEKNEEPTRKAG
jgi:hypothetical protein